MLKYIFFFFGSFGFIYEIWVISNLKKIFRFKKSIENSVEQKKLGNLKQSFFKDLPNSACSFIVCHLLYSFWALIGLFTSQWPLFIVLIFISFINTRLTRSKTISLEFFGLINTIDSLLCAIVIGFSIINAIHLHIPVFQGIMNLFK